MSVNKSPDDYLQSNIEKRMPCPACSGTGYVPKPKVELSADYPRWVNHPDQKEHAGERFLVRDADAHKAFHPEDHAALHAEKVSS